MKVEVTDQQDRKKRLAFEIPHDVVADELVKIYRHINATARLKGFRPGKIPKPILKRFFWPRIESEVIQNLVPAYYRRAVSEAALEPIGEPKFDDFFVEEGKSLSVGVTVEVKPDVDPKDYLNIEVSWKKAMATDKDVEDTLKRLQEKNAQFDVVEGRTIQEDDLVVLSYDGSVEGHPLDRKKREDIQIAIKAGEAQDDFMKSLIGMGKGEMKKVHVALPAYFPQKDLIGKSAVLDVTAKEIKEKRLPNIDDEFARDLGEYDDLEALKGDIRDQIQASLDRQAENMAREELIEKLLANNPVESPETMVMARIEDMIEKIERQLRNSGHRIDPKIWDREKVREELKPKALRDVHLSLIQEGIARKEGISVSEEEIERHLELLSLQAKQDFNELKERAKKDGTWDRLRSSLLREKAMDFLMEKAVRMEVPE